MTKTELKLFPLKIFNQTNIKCIQLLLNLGKKTNKISLNFKKLFSWRLPNSDNIQQVSWLNEKTIAIVKMVRHDTILCIYNMIFNDNLIATELL